MIYSEKKEENENKRINLMTIDDKNIYGRLCVCEVSMICNGAIN